VSLNTSPNSTPLHARLTGANLADQVADELRSAIQAGRYEPGARLVERRLAAELGISHVPIREALARLADEGLVERLPRRGSRVAGLSLRQLEELSSLRIMLEGFVAVRVQERLTPQDEKALRRTVKSMIDAARKGDVEKVLNLDRSLHEDLWKLADHEMLFELAAQLRGRISAFLRAATAMLSGPDLERHALTHVELIDVLVKGDPESAKAAMQAHIEDGFARVLGSMSPGTSKVSDDRSAGDDG
jgi:DNA-binding GntR family transcriptional regulator